MTVMPLVPRDAFVVLRTDGREEVVAFPAKRGGPRLAAVKAALGFDTLDFVTLSWRGRTPHLVMVVNDMGYETQTVEHDGHIELVPVRPRFPVNQRATELYLATCLPGTTHQIVGDVALMYDDD